jgi:hypothetical protein
MVSASVSITNLPDGDFLDPLFLGQWAMPVGAQWSHGMSVRELQAGANLLSAFALMIGGALGVGLPMTLVIIWVSS